MSDTKTTIVSLRLPTQALKKANKEEEVKQPEELVKAVAAIEALDPVVADKAVAYPQLRAGRLHQFMLRDGTVVKPINGIYVADTQEKFELLGYYLQQDCGLVFDDLTD